MHQQKSDDMSQFVDQRRKKPHEYKSALIQQKKQSEKEEK